MVMVNMIGRGREASDGSNYIRTLDALIIGGGAAGLAAAIYLSRFRRKVQVIDANQSRLLLIPTTHNYPGYPEGINGPDLLQRLRMQALRYGSQLIRSRPNELSGIK
jgi:thioredoxin reductase (NADPH)